MDDPWDGSVVQAHYILGPQLRTNCLPAPINVLRQKEVPSNAWDNDSSRHPM
jgi:hypothetical protein